MTDADDVILSVAGLRVRDSRDREILHGLDLDVRRGECLALVGESGAGKSLTLRALAGLLPHGFTVSGTMDFEGRTLCAPGAFAAVRGRRILYMAQQAMTAFDPLVRIGVQLGETASAAGLSGSKADEAVSRALRAVGLDPARILRAFPCELSGGMLQRVMTACVLILRPDVILADEPTSALDVVNVRAVLASLQEVRRTTGSALVLVTHDLGLAAGLADRFVILMSGGIVEKGGREIFERPSHPYTQRLALAWRRANAVLQESLAAGPAPAAEEPQRAPEAEPVLRIEGVTKYYASGSFLRRSVHEVLRGVNLEVRRGEVVGLIGGSGEGKSTLSRLILGLEAPTAGRILVRGADRSELCSGEASVVFQNYLDSADPVWTVGDVIEEPRVEACGRPRRCAGPSQARGTSRRVRVAPSPPALGRRAPARRDRARHGGRPVARRLRRGAQQPRRLRAGRDHGASCRAQARSCRLALHPARPQGRCKALRQGRRALRRPHRRSDGRCTHGQPLERGGQALRRGRGGAPSGVNGDVRGLRRRLRTAWTS